MQETIAALNAYQHTLLIIKHLLALTSTPCNIMEPAGSEAAPGRHQDEPAQLPKAREKMKRIFTNFFMQIRHPKRTKHRGGGPEAVVKVPVKEPEPPRIQVSQAVQTGDLEPPGPQEFKPAPVLEEPIPPKEYVDKQVQVLTEELALVEYDGELFFPRFKGTGNIIKNHAGKPAELPPEMQEKIVKNLVNTPEFVHFKYDPHGLNITCPNLNRIYSILGTCVFWYRRFRPQITRTSFVENLAQSAGLTLETVSQGIQGARYESFGVPSAKANEFRVWLGSAEVGEHAFRIRLTIGGTPRLATIPFKSEVVLFYLDGYLSPIFDGWGGRTREEAESTVNFTKMPGVFGWEEHRVHSTLFPLSQVEERLRHFMKPQLGHILSPVLAEHGNPNQARVFTKLFRFLSNYASNLEECKILVGPFHPF